MHIFVFPVGAGVNRLNSIGSALLNELPVAETTTAFKRLQTYFITFTTFSIPCLLARSRSVLNRKSGLHIFVFPVSAGVDRLNRLECALLNELPVAKTTTAFKRVSHILLHLLYRVYLLVAEVY